MEIPKIILVPKPETDEAKSAIGYEWNAIAGTRHFLGGKPDGVDEKDYPNCPDCKERMAFYCQIDSIGDKYDLADCMVIHTYVCFGCFHVQSQLTQTIVQ
jgi:hypothetical protein